MSALPRDMVERQLTERLYRPLAALRLRCRAYRALAGAVRLAGWLFAAAAAQYILDRWLVLSMGQRILFNTIITLLWGWAAYKHLILPLRAPLPDYVLAGWVDRICPGSRDHLSSAVQLATLRGSGHPHAHSVRAAPFAPVSQALIQCVLADACTLAQGVRFTGVLNHRAALARTLLLAVLGVAIWGGTALFPGLVGTWFARNWLLADLSWPQRTYLEPEGFDGAGRMRLARGSAVELVAQVRGVVPPAVQCDWFTAGGRRGREVMELVGEDRFVASLGVLSEDIRFRLKGGDAVTREYVIELVERPRVLSVSAEIVPPAYTGLEAYQLAGQTVFELQRGSTVRLRAAVSKPLAAARLIGPEGPVGNTQISTDAEGEGRREVSVTWDDPRSGTYHFALRDGNDIANDPPVRITMRIAQDEPPAITLELDGVGDMVTPAAEPVVRLEGQDRFGLVDVRVWIRGNDDEPTELSLHGFAAGRKSYETQLPLPLMETGVQPGDRLSIWAEAADNDPRGPNVATTATLQLRIVSREAFGDELLRRELELRREFERLISTQNILKDAVERYVAVLADPEGENARQQAVGLARRQSSVAERCVFLAGQFRRILAEMETNRMARPADRRRLIRRVSLPLEELGEQRMPASANRLGDLPDADQLEASADCLRDQADILQAMRAILADMLQWEGFREAVSLLEGIIAEQKELHAETRQRMEAQLEEILDLESILEEPDPDSRSDEQRP